MKHCALHRAYNKLHIAIITYQHNTQCTHLTLYCTVLITKYGKKMALVKGQIILQELEEGQPYLIA